jgi:hypothetical protein
LPTTQISNARTSELPGLCCPAFQCPPYSAPDFVKWVVDAPLQRRLALWLQEHGHDVIHRGYVQEPQRREERSPAEPEIRNPKLEIRNKSELMGMGQ